VNARRGAGAARAGVVPARVALVTLVTLALALAAAGCGADPPGPADAGAAAVEPPPGFPPLPAPADNPPTADRIALGRRLFHDTRLSRTKEIACASCHLQQHAFADPRRVSVGVEGRQGKRNAPALVNLAWATSLFWDGGVDTLERQAMAPIMDESEMDLPLEQAVARLAGDPEYEALFGRAFGEPPTPRGLTRALASFVRALVSGDAPYDRYRAGDRGALDGQALRGMALFFGERGECFHCHDGPHFTNDRHANNGTYVDGGDVGRQRVTGRAIDLGRFKVPTLRNVAVTAPYMHDGSIATLEDVVEHYARGGRGHPSTDPNVHRLDLGADDKQDLVAFLRALTDQSFLRDPRFGP
jgi:cytochrome c peroxidase